MKVWVTSLASKTEAGVGLQGGAGRSARRENNKKVFFDRPFLGAVSVCGCVCVCEGMHYLMVFTRVKGLWAYRIDAR